MSAYPMENDSFPHLVCIIKFYSTFCGHFMFFNEILSEALHFKKWKDLICISSKFSCVSDYGFEMSAHKISIRNCTLETLLDKKKGWQHFADISETVGKEHIIFPILSQTKTTL